MICQSCAGTPGGQGHSSVTWSSASIIDLSTDVSRTCFCGVDEKEMQSLLENFEMKLEMFLMSNYPGKGMDEIRGELKTMPRHANLRVHTAKRLGYRNRLKDEVRRRNAIALVIAAKNKADGILDISEKPVQPPLSSDEGSSMIAFSKESEF